MALAAGLRSPWAWMAVALALVRPPPITAQPFHVAPTYGGGVFWGSSLTAADLNGDGELDLIGSGPLNHIAVLLGDGIGGFETPLTFPAGFEPSSLDVADFNSDSILDVIVADYGLVYPGPGRPSGVPGALLLLLGDGSGGFGAPMSVDAGPNYTLVVARDLNSDGHADLLTSVGWNTLGLWLGDGGGHFTPATPVALGGGYFTGVLRLADFNADGKWDLALTGSAVKILLGDGNGGFSPPVLYLTGGQETADLVTGDFNGDAKLDITAVAADTAYFFPGDGLGTFGLAVQSPGVGAGRLDAGDLNEDGRLDLAGRGPGGVAALLGDGAGHFAHGPVYIDGTEYGPVLAADVDHDGHLDLLAPRYGVAVLLGDGTGNFEGLQLLPIMAPGFPQLAGGDFNEDGKADLGVTGFSSPGFILLGDGQGGFSIGGAAAGCGYVEAAGVGDFDGDTHLDLVGLSQQAACVLLGDGTGSLSTPVMTSVISWADLAVADFDEDGRSDLLVSRWWEDVVLVLLANGQGGFAPPVAYLMNTGPQAVAAGDWNGDGHADMVSAGGYSSNLSVRLGDGLGGFGPRTVIPLAQVPSGLFVGEWNEDGFLDLAFDTGELLLGDGTGSFAPAAGPPFAPGLPLPADFDQDGHEDIASITDPLAISPGDGAGGFGAAWNFHVYDYASSGASADFNSDGRPDIMLALQSGALWPFLSRGPMAADLTIAVDDGQGSAVPGLPVSYTVTVTNLGPRGVPGVKLTPTLPSILLSPAFSAAAGAYDPATGLWTGLNLAVGESATLTITGTVNASASGSITVSISVAAPSGYADPNAANDASADVDALTPLADLGVQASDLGDPVRVGAAATYETIVANAGPSNSPGATLSIALPSGATFVSSTPGPPACTESGGTVTCSLGSLPPGPGISASVTALLGTAGLVAATADVLGSVPDPQSANDTAAESTSVLAGSIGELVQGSRIESALLSLPGQVPPANAFRLRQAARTSWEIVVDGVTGDIGAGVGPTVEWIDDGTVAHPSVAAGAGASRSLRFENASPDSVADGYVRVASASCSLDCGPEDVYRIRARETTLFGARFNNSATQLTAVVVQNASSDPASGHVNFFDGSGAWLHSEPFILQSWQTLVLTPLGIPAIQGQSGSLTVSHDGRLGALAGKATAVEPSTGFTFDTGLVTRTH